MFKTHRLLAILIAFGILGCQSPEEECNEARVAAHDAWIRAMRELRREVPRLCFEVHGDVPDFLPAGSNQQEEREWQEASLAEYNCTAVASYPENRRMAESARGRAIEHRTATREYRRARERGSFNLFYAEETALEASDGVWDACRTVDP